MRARRQWGSFWPKFERAAWGNNRSMTVVRCQGGQPKRPQILSPPTGHAYFDILGYIATHVSTNILPARPFFSLLYRPSLS